MKQINNAKELIGQTITRLAWKECRGKLVIFLENPAGDEGYAVFDIDRGWEAGDEEIEFTNEELGAYDLKILGLISEQAYHDMREKQLEASRIRAEELRRRQYEKLKKEFG